MLLCYFSLWTSSLLRVHRHRVIHRVCNGNPPKNITELRAAIEPSQLTTCPGTRGSTQPQPRTGGFPDLSHSCARTPKNCCAGNLGYTRYRLVNREFSVLAPRYVPSRSKQTGDVLSIDKSAGTTGVTGRNGSTEDCPPGVCFKLANVTDAIGQLPG